MKKTLSTLLLFTVSLCTTVPLTGCSQSTVVNEVNTVLTEATDVLVVADPGAAWVPQMQNAIAALKTAEASWTTGGSVQVVIDALNTIEVITAVIPMTAAYSPLIDVLVAGIEAVLAALPATAASVNAKFARNPRIGRVTIVHHRLHSHVTEFKDVWNATAKANPALAGAVIN